MTQNVFQSSVMTHNVLHKRGLDALAAGDRPTAIRLFSQALLANPSDALSHSHLAYTMLLEHEFETAHILYCKTIELDPRSAIAYHGLAEIHEKMGDNVGAQAYRTRGLRLRPVTTLRYEGQGQPIDVLLLGAKGESNIDTKRFFDPQIFRVHALAVEYFPDDAAIPQFDVCFNAIGEPELGYEALMRAKHLLQAASGRIINHPDYVLRSGRVTTSELLRGIHGVRTPHTVRISRAELASSELSSLLAQQGIALPFLLRVPGRHTGIDFVMLREPMDVETALRTLDGDEFFAIEFIDTQSPDGLYRKYRAIAIGGELYPIHLAISSQWKVHYHSAQTADLTAHRAEEATFLQTMPQVLGEVTMARLHGIVRLLGLEYCGVDFTLAADGSLVVFEANATMGFAEPPNDPEAQYRLPAILRARTALTQLLRA